MQVSPDTISRTAGCRPIVWFDITLVRRYFETKRTHPTGIQRVIVELVREAIKSDPPFQLKFVEYRPHAHSFVEVERNTALQALSIDDHATKRQRLDGMVKRRLRTLLPFLRKAAGAFHGTAGTHPFTEHETYVNLDAWWDLRQLRAFRDIKKTVPGLRSAYCIYDLIPLSVPEFVEPGVQKNVVDGLPTLLDVATLLFTSSAHTGRDLAGHAKSFGVSTIPRLVPLRWGDGFSMHQQAAGEHRRVLDALGLDRPYVACVGTLEARKNQGLAVRAWRELRRKHGDKLPLLVLVGRWGKQGATLKLMLENAPELSRHIRVLDGVSDNQLDAIYRGARFTLFPSHFEGWGLPVAESLFYGKVCVASDNSSIPEAGGDFAVYFESDCRRALIGAVEPLLFDDTLLHDLETRVAEGFRPYTWSRTWLEFSKVIAELAAPDSARRD